VTENPRLAAFLNLISRTQEQTSLVAGADRLVGTFAQAVLQAMQAELSDDEMQLAVIIGHFNGCKYENSSPDYPFVLTQLEYWQAVYLEVAQFWLDRST
jgi:hypothetical protein